MKGKISRPFVSSVVALMHSEMLLFLILTDFQISSYLIAKIKLMETVFPSHCFLFQRKGDFFGGAFTTSLLEMISI